MWAILTTVTLYLALASAAPVFNSTTSESELSTTATTLPGLGPDQATVEQSASSLAVPSTSTTSEVVVSSSPTTTATFAYSPPTTTSTPEVVSPSAPVTTAAPVTTTSVAPVTSKSGGNDTPNAPTLESSDLSLDVPSTSTTPVTTPVTTPEAVTTTSQPGLNTEAPTTEETGTSLSVPTTSPSAKFSYSPDTTTSPTNETPTNSPVTEPTATSLAVPGTTTPAPFSYAPATTTEATSNPGGLIASIAQSIGETGGASAVPFTYAPAAAQSEGAAESANVYAASVTAAPTSGNQELIIGTQTLALSSPITLGAGPSAPVMSMVTDSAGSAAVVIAGSTIPLSSYIAQASAAGINAILTTAPAPAVDGVTTRTGARVYVTIGVDSVSQAANGAYMLGSQTLTPGASITEIAGGATQVVGLSVDSAGNTDVVIAGASTTSTTRVGGPKQSSSTVPQVVVNGQTYTLSGATLNAAAATSTSTPPSTTTSKHSASGTAAATTSTSSHGLASAGTSLRMEANLVAALAFVAGALALL